MKRFVRIVLSAVVLLLLSSVTTVGAQESIFEQIASLPKADVVYIPSSTLRGINSGAKMNGMNLGKFTGKVDGMQIISIDDRNEVRKAVNLMKSFNKNREYDVLIMTKSEDSKLTIYGKPHKRGKNDKYKDIVIYSLDDDDDFSLMNFIGSFVLKDLTDLR